jgi:hypothetical protein
MKQQKFKLKEFEAFKTNNVKILGGQGLNELIAGAATCHGTKCPKQENGEPGPCQDWEDDED